MRRLWAAVAAGILFFADAPVFAADKVRMAYVSPSVSLSLPWIAKESGILAKHDLAAEILLITGSPRLVQSLIAGDVDVAFAGVTALTRARVRGADVAILGASANVSSQKLMIARNSKVRRLEDLRGSTIGVSQYGSEADSREFAHFPMHFLHQWARRVNNNCEVFGARLLPDGRRNTVGAKNQFCAGRHFVEGLDEAHTAAGKILYDIEVVNDFVKDIDRRAVPFESPFNSFDRHLDARAKSARSGEYHSFNRHVLQVCRNGETVSTRSGNRERDNLFRCDLSAVQRNRRPVSLSFQKPDKLRFNAAAQQIIDREKFRRSQLFQSLN